MCKHLAILRSYPAFSRVYLPSGRPPEMQSFQTSVFFGAFEVLPVKSAVKNIILGLFAVRRVLVVSHSSSRRKEFSWFYFIRLFSKIVICVQTVYNPVHNDYFDTIFTLKNQHLIHMLTSSSDEWIKASCRPRCCVEYGIY